MNISYNWLNKYISTDKNSEELTKILTFSGIEVEKITKVGEDLDSIIVAEVISTDKHPNADKLKKCVVFDGENNLDIVCGAPNCRAGLKVALAPIGSSIGDFKIKKSKIRGEFSYGMLCSEKELGLSDSHEGIMELDSESKIGKSLAEQLNIKDVVYEVEITPNRPDLLGLYEIARDISSTLNKEIKPLEFYKEDANSELSDLEVENRDDKLCPRYTAKLIKNVDVKDSPEWLKLHLLSVGIKPINNIVDITNFVMHEMGHPLHAFDYDKIKDKKIVIRKAEKGESIEALDNNTYELDGELVISDSKNPIAIAGIIGGADSQIDENTKNVVLEVANFSFQTVRDTSKNLKIFTDSAYRFERGLSSKKVDSVRERALLLINELTNGQIVEGISESDFEETEDNVVSLSYSKLLNVTGLEISEEEIFNYLDKLGLELLEVNGSAYKFRIPNWRSDLTREIDLIEEVLRVHGFDKVKKKSNEQIIMQTESFYLKRKIEDFFVQKGFCEALNSSFESENMLKKLELDEDDERLNFITLKNPMGESQSILRTNLVNSLLRNTELNINFNADNIRMFELNKIYMKNHKDESEELFHVAGVVVGSSIKENWNSKGTDFDFYALKGIMEDFFHEVNLPRLKLKYSTDKYYQSGVAADVFVGRDKIGSFGKMDLKLLNNFGIESDLFSFDMSIGKILKYSSKKKKYNVIPKYPAVVRDLSFLIDKKIVFEDIKNEILKINRKIIDSVLLFDVYTGKNIEKTKKSLSLSIKLQSTDKTLKDKFVNNLLNKIIKKLENKFNIQMR